LKSNSFKIIVPKRPSASAYVSFALRRVIFILMNFFGTLLLPFLPIYQAFWPRSVDTTIKPHAYEYHYSPKKKNEMKARRGVLFIHGFSSNPEIFKSYALKFRDEGYIVHSVRLAGHGTSPGDFATTSCVDWYLSARDKFIQFKDEVEDVVIVAHSLGSLLAVILTSLYPVHSLILLSPPVKIRKTPLFIFNPLLRPLSRFIRFWPASYSPVLKERGFHVYPVHPLKAVAGLYDTNKIADERLPLIKCPVLVVIADNDEFIHLSTLDYILDRLRTDILESWVAPNATHILIDSPQVEEFESIIHNFVVKYSPPVFS
jgi:carboxylesterase